MAKKGKATRAPPAVRLVWWQVTLIRGKRGERLGMVLAPEGDAAAAMTAADARFNYLTPTHQQRLMVRPAPPSEPERG
jgi:hypothetical protein